MRTHGSNREVLGIIPHIDSTRLYRNDFTAENTESTESEKKEMNNSDTNRFDMTVDS